MSAHTPGEGLTDTLGRRNRRLADKACPECGKAFRPHRASSLYCSRSCAGKKNGRRHYIGESWWTCPRGYVVGRVWIDGKPVHKRLHRHLMEQHLGRPLAADEDVHHRDGNKQNNDLSNLEVIGHGDHARAHNAERTYRSGYRLNLTSDEGQTRPRHPPNSYRGEGVMTEDEEHTCDICGEPLEDGEATAVACLGVICDECRHREFEFAEADGFQ